VGGNGSWAVFSWCRVNVPNLQGGRQHGSRGALSNSLTTACSSDVPQDLDDAGETRELRSGFDFQTRSLVLPDMAIDPIVEDRQTFDTLVNLIGSDRDQSLIEAMSGRSRRGNSGKRYECGSSRSGYR
jgi:hypothetical protein